MRIQTSSFVMTVVLAAMTAFGSISNDMYVPSLPAIAVDLRATPGTVQLTLSAFLVGFAIGQIFYGPLSDKLGRKPMLLGGFILFVAATFACMTARSINMLIFARVMQSLGASGPIILARAMVRDLYEGSVAARQLSLMATMMGVSPVIAPVIGGVLQDRFGWRASFILVECLGVTIGAICLVSLPETLKHRQSSPLNFRSVARSYKVVWQKPSFRAYSSVLTASYSGLFAFVSASSFVLQDIYGLGPLEFSLAFAACSVAFVFGSIGSARLASRRHLDETIQLGVSVLAIGGLAQLILTQLKPHNVFCMIVPEMVFMAGVGLSLSTLLAAAMSPFPDRAGAASSLLGVIQMTGAALIGAALGAFLGQSALPFALVTALTGVGALVLFAVTGNARRANVAQSS